MILCYGPDFNIIISKIAEKGIFMNPFHVINVMLKCIYLCLNILVQSQMPYMFMALHCAQYVNTIKLFFYLPKEYLKLYYLFKNIRLKLERKFHNELQLLYYLVSQHQSVFNKTFLRQHFIL